MRFLENHRDKLCSIDFQVLLLHNHGAVCCGATVEEAFYNVYNTVLACETQIKLMPIGVENLVLVSDETRKQVYDAAHRTPDAGATGDKKPKQFRVGELEFEALIRMLDNAVSFRWKSNGCSKYSRCSHVRFPAFSRSGL